MQLNRILHMMITKYLWGAGWQSFYWQLAFRWSKDHKHMYRLRDAYDIQIEEDRQVERDSYKNQEVTNEC